MNIQVIWNGTDITNETIEYERTGKICSGVSNCTLTLGYTGRNFNPYNTIVIYEGGIKKGTYFVTSITRDVNAHTVILETQDSTKQLNDYFIPDTYDIEEPTYAKYWIEKFLTEAGVSYQFDVSGSGSVLNNQDVLGMQSALEVLTKLVQISGWYFYADADNVIHINTLSKNPSNYKFYLRSSEVLELGFHKDDKMLRNRSVVWGASNPVTQQWAFADVRVKTGYETSAADLRSTLVVNTHIENKASAVAIANKFLKEMKNATEIKTVVCAGYYNFILGDTVFVQTRKFNGNGLVTSYVVSATTNGFTTTFVLDERCPRMFGYYAYDGYVYISTAGDGVWRKPLRETHVWENFSDGLDDLNIIDLSINNGIFSCVSSSGNLYTRSSIDSEWTLFSTPEFITYFDVVASGIICTSCSVDKFNNHIYATFSDAANIQFTTPIAILPSGVGIQGSWLVDISSLYPITYSVTPIIVGEIVPSGTITATEEYSYWFYTPTPSGESVVEIDNYEVAALDIDNTGITQTMSIVKNKNSTLGEGSFVSTVHPTLLTTAPRNIHMQKFSKDTSVSIADVAAGKYRVTNDLPSGHYMRVCSQVPEEYGLFETLKINYISDKFYAYYESPVVDFTQGKIFVDSKNILLGDKFFTPLLPSSYMWRVVGITRENNIFTLYLWETNANNVYSISVEEKAVYRKFEINIDTESVTETILYNSTPNRMSLSQHIFVGDYIYHIGFTGSENILYTINVYTGARTDTSLSAYTMRSVSQFIEQDGGACLFFESISGQSLIINKVTFTGNSCSISTVSTVFTAPTGTTIYYPRPSIGIFYLADIGVERHFTLLYQDKNTKDFKLLWTYNNFGYTEPAPPSFNRYILLGYFIYPGEIFYVGSPEAASNVPISRNITVGGDSVVLSYKYTPMYGIGIDPFAACVFTKAVNSSNVDGSICFVNPSTLEFYSEAIDGSENTIFTDDPSQYIGQDIDDIDHTIYINTTTSPSLYKNLCGYNRLTGTKIKEFSFYTKPGRMLGNTFGGISAVYSNTPVPGYGGIGTYGLVHRTDNKFYGHKLAFPAPAEVESSTSFPISVFGDTSGLDTTPSGLIPSGFVSSSGSFIYISPFGVRDTYSKISINALSGIKITDAREVEIEDGESGELKCYVVFPQSEVDGSQVTFFDATDIPTQAEYYSPSGIFASGIGNRYSFSGYVDHLEFTNFAQFEFISITGTPGVFYQKERDASKLSERVFINRNTNLPTAPITQIRCDDSL